MRLFPQFYALRNPAIRATGAAAIAGLFAGLAIVACTDSKQTSITAPPSAALSGPRNPTISSGGFANAQKVSVCVSGDSPPDALNGGTGSYKFKNAGFLSPYEIGVSDATVDGANGGNGTTVENVSDGTDYVVPWGGCVIAETRTSPDHGYPGSAECPIFLGTWTANFNYAAPPTRGIRDAAGHGQWVTGSGGTSGATIPTFNDAGGTTTDGGVTWQDQGPYPTSGPVGGHWCSGFPDTWSGVTLELSSNPVTAIYSSTDCLLDNGDKPSIPNPCGAGNAHTRAYANHDHGAFIDYHFVRAPTTSTGQIAPTNTTCADYVAGTSATLAQIDAGFKNSTINSVSPGVFFYYAHVTKSAGQIVGFTQNVNPDAGGLPKYDVQQGQAYLYDLSCTTVATLATSAGEGSGASALAAGSYILGVKFSTAAAKGFGNGLSTSGTLLATHHYVATVAASSVPTTTASIDTKSK